MANKIKKILIANRGEIALRVINTCRKLGIKSVAVYTESESDAPHRLAADEAYCLGEGTLAQTYLNQQLIVDITKKSGADAIHPGYGFLSENASFCDLVEESKIIFIGPKAESMTLMGDKIGSKVAMEKTGIPLIPGYHGDNQEVSHLKEIAVDMGFPVLIKATAGGGGKGMRIVENANDFVDSLNSAKSEAQKAFGNDKVLIEKYITKPRHIEVQVLSDTHNQHFHLFERECSIQRRYQKIIEESPSPALDDKLRKDICETAVKISSSINYRGAGTVEFILDDDNKFYFLEMNTRLQVEHPVTEMITGKDLVELQIKVAQGDKLNFSQSDLSQTGHAIECRLYAEDPDNQFLPSIGKITKLQYPVAPYFRVDYGYVEGSDVSVNFDPMLAKLIVWDSNRENAIGRMKDMLKQLRILGVRTNRDYLGRILSHNAFIQGDIDTNFVKKYEKELGPAKVENDFIALLAQSVLSFGSSTTQTHTHHSVQTAWDTIGNFRNS